MYQSSVKLVLAELTYSHESFLKVVVTHPPQLCKGLIECKIRNLKWLAIFSLKWPINISAWYIHFVHMANQIHEEFGRKLASGQLLFCTLCLESVAQ